MKNTINTKKGFFTIIERYGKDFKIEKFDPYVDNLNFLYVEFFSNFNLGVEELSNLFKKFEPEIIQIMKVNIDRNIELYHNHFDIDYQLIDSLSIALSPKDLSFKECYEISCSKFLKMDIKSESLEYLESLTSIEKRNAYGFS